MQLPYIICECGVNHGGDRELAARMIREAAAAGADAVKFQYYKADDLAAPDSPIYFSDNGQPVRTQREFFARYDSLRREDYAVLAQVAKECGVDFGCTVFQPEDVPWVDPLVKWHKLASADINNWPLFEALLATGKPIFASMGAATLDEVDAVRFKMPPGGRILHCVLEYPTPLGHANLAAIGHCYGYSCHVPFDLDVLTTAWLLGARVIEKHFTLDKTQPGNDHAHSMEPDDLRALLAKWRKILLMIGDGQKGTVWPHEEAARRNARRSLYAARDLPAGHTLTQADLRYLRPAHGLRPGQEGVLLGKPLRTSVTRHQLLTAECV